MQIGILRQPVIDAGAKLEIPHNGQKRMAFGQAQNGTSMSVNITSAGSFNASTPMSDNWFAA